MTCSWDDLEGVPAFRTLSAAKKAIDALERGEFHFQFCTRKEAVRWRDANHIRWEVREEDGLFCVIPDEWHRRLYQEVDWNSVTPQDAANAIKNALEEAGA